MTSLVESPSEPEFSTSEVEGDKIINLEKVCFVETLIL